MSHTLPQTHTHTHAHIHTRTWGEVLRDFQLSLYLLGNQFLQRTLARSKLMQYGQNLFTIAILMCHLLRGIFLSIESCHTPNDIQLSLDQHIVRGRTESGTELIDELYHIADTARIYPIVDRVQGKVLITCHLRVGEDILAAQATPVRLHRFCLDGNHQALAALFATEERR